MLLYLHLHGDLSLFKTYLHFPLCFTDHSCWNSKHIFMVDLLLCGVLKTFFKLLLLLLFFYYKINLKHGVRGPETRTGTETDTCTACAGTMILEFAALSRFTGDPVFEVQINIHENVMHDIQPIKSPQTHL